MIREIGVQANVGVSSDETKCDMYKFHKSHWTVIFTVIKRTIDLHNQTLVVQLQKYPNTFPLGFLFPHKLFKILLHRHTFFIRVLHGDNGLST